MRPVAGAAPPAIAYCIGTVLHRRPSASFLTAATTSSSRGERPMAIQPVRQPGARYAFDRLENEMIARVGIEAADRRDRAVEAEIAVDLVGEDQQAVPVGEVEQRAPRRRSDRRRRSGCSDR